jgi:hypothetical protein
MSYADLNTLHETSRELQMKFVQLLVVMIRSSMKTLRRVMAKSQAARKAGSVTQ